MEEIFVTKVRINKVRHLENLEIPLSDTERKHLILTGKNGSGKTSVLNALNHRLHSIYLSDEQFLKEVEETRKGEPLGTIIQSSVNGMPPPDEDSKFEFNHADRLLELYHNEQFIICYFKAKRSTIYNKPSHIQKVSLKQYYRQNAETNGNSIFTNYLVHLRAEKAFAFEEGDNDTVNKIDKWFDKFLEELRIIFEEPKLTYSFDRSGFSYNFKIHLPNREPFDLLTLSDGYASILDIVTELIIRMESKASQLYDLQGIVLIDEIETHLHIDLQKKILPFLTAFFPKIQFIVTTHSPFVLSSIDNAVIYDLEKQIRVEDLSGYSYTNIVKGYFDADEYSKEVKDKIGEYEQLIAKSHYDTNLLTLEEKAQYYELKRYFEGLPKTLSPELQLRIQQLELAQLSQ